MDCYEYSASNKLFSFDEFPPLFFSSTICNHPGYMLWAHYLKVLNELSPHLGLFLVSLSPHN